MNELNELVARIESLNAADKKPFPYDGCRQLIAADPDRYAAIIPDLDRYLSELAGYRSWGKRILNWSDDKIETVAHQLQQSFFERYPQYSTDQVAPDVRQALEVADRTRSVLFEILQRLRAERTTRT